MTYDRLMSFPEPSEVIKNFINWVDSHQTLFALLGHNIQFDRKFIYSWLCRNGSHTEYVTRFRPNDYCTLGMAREAFKGKRNKPISNKLGDLCRFFNIELNNVHDALADIKATYKLYDELKAMLPMKTPIKIDMNYMEKRRKYLHSSYVQFNPEGDVYINCKATEDPEAMSFISEELYHLYGEK